MPTFQKINFDLSNIAPKSGMEGQVDALHRDERLGAAMETIKSSQTLDTTYFDNGLTKAKLVDKVAGLNVTSRF